MRHLLAPLLAGALAASHSHAATACSDARDVLRVLREGRIEDVWRVIDAGGLDGLDDPEDEALAPCRGELTAGLERAVRRIDDDRVVARLIDEIDFEETESLVPVLRAALRHRSPDVRRHALHAVARTAERAWAPDVEALFAEERDPRVRADAVRALGATESRSALPELRGLAHDDDADLRHAAVWAIGEMVDADSVGLLETVARGDGAENVRIAISALAEWADLAAATDALVRLASNGPEAAASVAYGALITRGVDALPDLARIADARRRNGDEGGAARIESVIDQIEGRIASDTRTITSYCGGQTGKIRRGPALIDVPPDEFRPLPQFDVAPRDGAATVRCRDAPGFAWRDILRPRVEAGANLLAQDTFVWAGETWFAVISPVHLCWLPESELAIASDEERGRAAPGPAAWEFDALVGELSSPAAIALEHIGWLTWLDASDDIAAVRLELDPSNRDAICRLIAIRASADGALATAIGTWLWKYGESWLQDPELRPALPTSDPRFAED